MKILKACSLLAMTVFVMGSQAFAQPPEVFTCSTYSNGIIFENISMDVKSLKQNVLDECLTAPRIITSQCLNNLTCSNLYEAIKLVSCSTSSNGLTFYDVSHDEKSSKETANILCISNSQTDPEECAENLRCSL